VRLTKLGVNAKDVVVPALGHLTDDEITVRGGGGGGVFKRLSGQAGLGTTAADQDIRQRCSALFYVVVCFFREAHRQVASPCCAETPTLR
jgi:hypothetical protein